MKLLEERIAREGKVLPGNVVKVDGFLNHRVDAAFLGKLADEFIAHFDINGLTAVMTVEASGIPLATVCAEKMGVPMIFAKICANSARVMLSSGARTLPRPWI